MTQRHRPGALVLSIATLDYLVLSGQNFLLQDFCAPALVDARDLENLGRVDIGVVASAHDGDTADHALIYLEDTVVRMGEMRNKKERETWTEE